MLTGLPCGREWKRVLWARLPGLGWLWGREVGPGGAERPLGSFIWAVGLLGAKRGLLKLVRGKMQNKVEVGSQPWISLLGFSLFFWNVPKAALAGPWTEQQLVMVLGGGRKEMGQPSCHSIDPGGQGRKYGPACSLPRFFFPVKNFYSLWGDLNRAPHCSPAH